MILLPFILLCVFAARNPPSFSIPGISDTDLSGCVQVDISYYNPQSGEQSETQLTDSDLIQRLIDEAARIKGRRDRNRTSELVGGAWFSLTFRFSDRREPVSFTRAGQQLVVGTSYYTTDFVFGSFLLDYLYEIN